MSLICFRRRVRELSPDAQHGRRQARASERRRLDVSRGQTIRRKRSNYRLVYLSSHYRCVTASFPTTANDFADRSSVVQLSCRVRPNTNLYFTIKQWCSNLNITMRAIMQPISQRFICLTKQRKTTVLCPRDVFRGGSTPPPPILWQKLISLKQGQRLRGTAGSPPSKGKVEGTEVLLSPPPIFRKYLADLQCKNE